MPLNGGVGAAGGGEEEVRLLISIKKKSYQHCHIVIASQKSCTLWIQELPTAGSHHDQCNTSNSLLARNLEALWKGNQLQVWEGSGSFYWAKIPVLQPN